MSYQLWLDLMRLPLTVAALLYNKVTVALPLVFPACMQLVDIQLLAGERFSRAFKVITDVT